MASKDIDRFWRDTLARAAQTPLDATFEPVKEPLPFFKFRVTYRSLDGVLIRAYLGAPITGPADGRLPVIVTAPGYGGWEFGSTLSECQHGCFLLQVYPRGQGESGALWQVREGAYEAWVNHGREKPEGFYYQGAYLDLLRGVDAVLTRPEADPARIGLIGTSQGGCLVLGAAALDARVRAVAAHVPYLCDLRHNPAQANTELSRDPVFLQTWDFFDPVNLADRIRAPVLLSSGGQDKICPAVSIRAVFDRLAGIKALAHYPDLPHTSSIDFYQMSWEWMQRHVWH
jgi:cephalosporin-C deacetylase